MELELKIQKVKLLKLKEENRKLSFFDVFLIKTVQRFWINSFKCPAMYFFAEELIVNSMFE